MNNFTPRAQQLLALSRKEADRLNHTYVGTEHLLLGLIKLRMGVAVNVLERMGVELESARREVEREVGSGQPQRVTGNIPYTPRVKKVLALANKEAKLLNHSYVGTEHILLGLLREGEGIAARVLKRLNVDIQRARSEILAEIDPNFSPEDEEEDDDNNDEFDDISDSSIEDDDGTGLSHDEKEQLRQHPLVQRQLWTIQQIEEQKEFQIANQDFERAAALRESELKAKKDLLRLYIRVTKNPHLGLKRNEIIVRYSIPVEFPTGQCYRSDSSETIANKLLDGRSIILIAERGTGKSKLGGFVAERLLRTKEHPMYIHAYQPNHAELMGKGESGEYEAALDSFVKALIQEGNCALFMPSIHNLIQDGREGNEMVRAWSRALPYLLAEEVPLLVWTEPNRIPDLREVWPRFLAELETIILPTLEPAIVASLLSEEVDRISEKHYISIEPECIALIQNSSIHRENDDLMGEPGRSINLLHQIVRRFLSERAHISGESSFDLLLDKIQELERIVRNHVAKRDFFAAHEAEIALNELKDRAVLRINGVPIQLQLSTEQTKFYLNTKLDEKKQC